MVWAQEVVAEEVRRLHSVVRLSSDKRFSQTHG
jgi:hypothetical protein